MNLIITLMTIFMLAIIVIMVSFWLPQMQWYLEKSSP